MNPGITGHRLDLGTVRLVAIIDSMRGGVDVVGERAAAAVRGGATMLQLRLKDENARVLVEVARVLRHAAPAVPLVVNGRADVALAAGAQGVHLDVDDLSPEGVRRFVPASFVIGASVGTDTDVVRGEGADYVAIGPVFPSSRSDTGGAIGLARFTELAGRCQRPALAVGGMAITNAGDVLRAGACGIAVLSGFPGAADPMQHAREYRHVLDASGR